MQVFRFIINILNIKFNNLDKLEIDFKTISSKFEKIQAQNNNYNKNLQYNYNNEE